MTLLIGTAEPRQECSVKVVACPDLPPPAADASTQAQRPAPMCNRLHNHEPAAVASRPEPRAWMPVSSGVKTRATPRA